jgi:hypothetical protein
MMLADAKIRYIILLACLIIGPIVILVGVTNRWLWLRPIPDVSQVLVISSPGYTDTIQGYYGPREGSIFYNNPATIPDDQPVIMMYFFPTEPRSYADPPEIIRQDESFLVYPDWHTWGGDENPEWILAVDDNCIVLEDGARSRYSQSDANLISTEAALQVTITEYPSAQINTGTITAVYIDPPYEIFRRRWSAFQYIIVGCIMTVIGVFYFYGPRRGWLRWREGLTMPDDAPFWES